MIKMIALDLDNTLLMKDLTVPQETTDVLHEAAKRGVYIVIASGRMYPAAKRYADMIGSKDPVVSYNGAEIRSGDGSLIYENPISADIIKKLLTVCMENNIYVQLYRNDEIVIERWTAETESYPDAHVQPVIEVGSWKDAADIIQTSPKALLTAEPDDVPRIMSIVKESMGDDVSLTRSGSQYVEVLSPGVSKREGLKILAEKLGIARSEVMACGDNLNDLEMVSWAGTGVAVANAVPALKEAASYVSAEERSFGVAEAVRKFVL
jgi:hypothetical protein